MTSKKLLAAAVLAGLVGCADMGGVRMMAHTPGKPQVQRCNDPTCTVEIVVDATSTPCKITSPTKRDGVSVKDGIVTVIWEIKPSSYVFDPKGGIDFPGAPPNAFTNGKANGNKFTVTDNNNVEDHKGVHPYKISVQSADGSKTCQLDPFVVNE